MVCFPQLLWLWLRTEYGIGQDFGNVADANAWRACRHSISEHHEAEGARNRHGLCAGVDHLLHASLPDALKEGVVEPHASAAATAAGCLPAVSGQLDEG